MHFIDVDLKCINMKIADRQVNQLHKILEYARIQQEN
jgi:hypothetical protein